MTEYRRNFIAACGFFFERPPLRATGSRERAPGVFASPI